MAVHVRFRVGPFVFSQRLDGDSSYDADGSTIFSKVGAIIAVIVAIVFVGLLSFWSGDFKGFLVCLALFAGAAWSAFILRSHLRNERIQDRKINADIWEQAQLEVVGEEPAYGSGKWERWVERRDAKFEMIYMLAKENGYKVSLND